MIVRVVRELCSSKVHSVIVVTASGGEVRDALADLPAYLVVNPRSDRGISSSIRTGVEAVPADTAGALICLADMPFVCASDVNGLIDAFESNCDSVLVPVRAGRRGNPVLFPRRLFGALVHLEGDRGARDVIEQENDRLVSVSIDHSGVFFDVDTPADLHRAAELAARTRAPHS
jgi:molybdenum cofactor cytidylyltransferase